MAFHELRSKERSGLFQYTQKTFNFGQNAARRTKAIPIPSPLNLSSLVDDLIDEVKNEEMDIEEIEFEFKNTVQPHLNELGTPTLEPIHPTPASTNYDASLQATSPLAKFQSPQSNKLPRMASTCSICNFFIDDDLLELSCNHICHRDCFINNILTCKICSEPKSQVLQPPPQILSVPTTGQDKSFVTPTLGPTDVPMTPSDQMIPDPLRDPPSRLTKNQQLHMPQPQEVAEAVYKKQQEAAVRLLQRQLQLLSPRSSFNKNLNRDLFDSLMKPKVKFIKEFDDEKLVVDTDRNNEDYQLNYLINVRPPKLFNCMNDDKHLDLKTQIFDGIKFSILQNAINLNDEDVIDFNNLGKLILFEIVDISTTGNAWDQVRLLLFEKAILLIELTGEMLIGQMTIEQDLKDMTRFVSGIRLSLNNEALPELQICSEIPLIISRLEYYLTKLLSKEFVEETSLFQTTTNGWGSIKEIHDILPEEIVTFQNCIENNLEIPESLLVKSMPSSEIIPLNLIISVTLLNNSNLTNSEYRAKLINYIETVRHNLRSFDRLSLIFVGIDGAGFPSKKGSFIGSIEPNWSGWDSIYNEVKVQSNLDNKQRPILTSNWDELQLTLDKCKDLFPFLNSDSNNVNKLVVLSSNTYEPVLVPNQKLSHIETQIKMLINNNEKNLSIDFFRIGKNYTADHEFGHRVCSQPSLILNDVLKVPFGCQLTRFSDFEEFTSGFLQLLKTSYHQICLPSITVDLLKIIGTREIVKFHKIEVNGKLIEIENFSNLRLSLNNITANGEQAIMLQLKLDLNKLNFDNLNSNERTIDLPLFSYMASWLNESDDYKVLNTKLQQDRPMTSFSSFLDRSLTPPMHGDDTFARDNRKNKRYLKKEIDLELIKGFRLITQSQLSNSQEILDHLARYLSLTKRNLEIDALELQDKNDDGEQKRSEISSDTSLSNYIDIIYNELVSLKKAFNSNEQTALITCKDLRNWLL